MIARLDQKTKDAKLKMLKFQNYALHESIVLVLHFDGTDNVWVQFLA